MTTPDTTVTVTLTLPPQAAGRLADAAAASGDSPGGYAARLIDDRLTDLHYLTGCRWRQGRHRGEHVYAQLGAHPADEDPPIGTFSSGALATEAVACHNQVHGYT